MEIIFELLGQLVFGVISLVVGTAIGAMCLVVMLRLRLIVAHVGRRMEIPAPDGARWFVRFGFGPDVPLSRQLTGMKPSQRNRRRTIVSDDRSVHDAEIWHPKRMVDAFDEAVGLAAPFVLAAVLVVATVVAIELIVAIPVAAVVLLISWIRGHWQVVVVAPDGQRVVRQAASWREARIVAEGFSTDICAGKELSLGGP